MNDISFFSFQNALFHNASSTDHGFYNNLTEYSDIQIGNTTDDADYPSVKYGMWLIVFVIFLVIVVAGIITGVVVYCSCQQERMKRRRREAQELKRKSSVLEKDSLVMRAITLHHELSMTTEESLNSSDHDASRISSISDDLDWQA